MEQNLSPKRVCIKQHMNSRSFMSPIMKVCTILLYQGMEHGGREDIRRHME